jgi:hypothetical protein
VEIAKFKWNHGSFHCGLSFPWETKGTQIEKKKKEKRKKRKRKRQAGKQAAF